MSKASSPADARAESRLERWQHWIAVLFSGLLHLGLLLLALSSSPVTMTSPQGSSAGSRMAVDFIGATAAKPTPKPPTPAAAARKPAAKSPAASRVRSTAVAQADDPVPPTGAAVADSLTAAPIPQPSPLAETPPTPTPADAPNDDARDRARARTATPPSTPQRRTHVWGQPPGMLAENLAPENAGTARSPATNRGRRNDAAATEPSLEVGGYQVYYDLRNEIRLRAWRDQGMTEIFLPLPGTQRYMVCPLETALKRDSGPCRLLEPDDPELKNIGDARDVINMQQVYRQGEPVWRGPGPYR